MTGRFRVAPADLRALVVAVGVALAAASCGRNGPTAPADPCGPAATRTLALENPTDLFTPRMPEDFSAPGSAVRYYDWAVVVDSACIAAVSGEDSVTFTVGTTGSVPPSLTVTGIVVVGEGSGALFNTVILDRFATLDGYLYSGTQKTFDMRRVAYGTASTAIPAIVQLSFPAVGTLEEDLASLQNFVRTMTFRFSYRTP